jgi:hypothetical protein
MGSNWFDPSQMLFNHREEKNRSGIAAHPGCSHGLGSSSKKIRGLLLGGQVEKAYGSPSQPEVGEAS